MARKLICDNFCGKVVDTDHYGDFLDEAEKKWFSVTRHEHSIEVDTPDNEEMESEIKEVNSEVKLEFCSEYCVAEYFSQKRHQNL